MEEQLSTFTYVREWLERGPHEQPPYVMFPIIATSTVITVSLFRTAYFIMKKSGVKSDIAHRILGVFKGVFAVTSAYFVGNLGQKALDAGLDNNWAQTFVLLVSNGYYVHDSLYFMYYSMDDVINLAHHFIAVITLSYSMVIGELANVVLFYNWAFEATSIPLHLRYIMRSWKMRASHPKLFTTTELTFIIMYAVERFIFGVHFSFYVLQSGDVVPFIPKILCLCLNMASFAWYNSIFLLFKRRYGDEFEFLKDFFPV